MFFDRLVGRRAGLASRSTRKARQGAEQQLVKVVGHPIRVKALAVLAQRVASPKEIAAELGEKLSNVSYHVRELEALGVIELVDTKQRRGATEHYYRAVSRPPDGDRAWGKLSRREREAASTYFGQLIVTDFARSQEAGLLDRRADRHLSRTPLLVDEEGWEELRGIHDATLERVLEVRDRCDARRAGSREDGVRATSVQMLFELPAEEPPPAADRRG
jgi:DNA-binding transcriptional ArsR family regulator